MVLHRRGPHLQEDVLFAVHLMEEQEDSGVPPAFEVDRLCRVGTDSIPDAIAHASPVCHRTCVSGGPARIRTWDRSVMSRLL